MRLASCAISVVALLTLSVSADTSISTVCLPGGSSAVGSYTLASVIAHPTACTTQLVGSAEFDPGYLCLEADDLGIPGDINHDGMVNGIDIGYLLADWGTSLTRSDVNRDGFVNGSDLGMLLANWG
jgi:hypothetical protein